jgi:hypothetical protein
MYHDLMKEGESNEDFLPNIWYSDECMFGLDKEVNEHKSIYWSVENPHFSLPVTNNKKKNHC